MMHLLFVATLATQIQTGADLLSACRQTDTSACDAFIRQTMMADPTYGCLSLDDMPKLRKYVIATMTTPLDKNPAGVVPDGLQAMGARDALQSIFAADACGAE